MSALILKAIAVIVALRSAGGTIAGAMVEDAARIPLAVTILLAVALSVLSKVLQEASVMVADAADSIIDANTAATSGRDKDQHITRTAPPDNHPHAYAW